MQKTKKTEALRKHKPSFLKFKKSLLIKKLIWNCLGFSFWY